MPPADPAAPQVPVREADRADLWWWADDPEIAEGDPEELALAHEWADGKVYRVMRAVRLSDAFAVPVSTPNEEVEVKVFDTEEAAIAFAAARLAEAGNE